MVARTEYWVEIIRQCHNPFAPDLYLFGSRTNAPIRVFGKGSSQSRALTRQWGEAAEREAMYLQKGLGWKVVLNGTLEWPA